MRALLAGDALRPADAGAADRDPQAALGLGGGIDGGLHRLGLHHVHLHEARAAVAELDGERLALLGVEVGDHDRSRRARAGRGRWRRRARRPRRRPARSLPSIFIGADAHSARPTHASRGRLCRLSGSSLARRPPIRRGRSPTASRRRATHTLKLIEPLTDEQLNRVYSPILSPLIWDLGHIANFEELWLVRNIGGREPLRGDLGDFYDAIEQPRKIRGELPILKADEVRPYMEQVRERTLEVLDEIDLEHRRPAAGRRLHLRDAARPRAPAQRDDAAAAADGRVLRAGRGRRRPGVRAGQRGPGDGRGRGRRARDRRRPAPTASPTTTSARATAVELEAFEIDRTPVTNAAYIEFLERHRTPSRPMYWERDGEGGWVRTAMGRTEPVDPAPARDPRLLGRGRRLRALGRQAAADRARVGGGRRGRRPRARQPRPARLRHRPRRRLRGRRLGLRRRADARRRLGVDLERLHAPTRASRRSRTPSTPRSSSATSTRCCAGAPGRRAATSSAPASATGTCPSAARSSPASAAPEDLGDPRPQRPSRVTSTSTCRRAGRCPGWRPTSAPG